ncbi:MAG: type II secretion system GspH family protein [Phycisphaerales bacterium]|nr:type II secretion system GspH family protein [Phycisphaerales bacterium]
MTNRLRLKQVRGGYTLVELMVVVGILAVAGAMLVPRLVDSSMFGVQAAARALVSDITFAQNDAWAMQRVRRFQFLTDAHGEIHGYAILAPDPENTYDQAFDADTAQYLEHRTAVGADGRYIVDFRSDARFSDVEIESVDLEGRDWVAFDALGGPIGASWQPMVAGGQIRLRGESGAYLIQLSGFTGKISLSSIDD